MTAIIANLGLGLFDATRNSVSNSPFQGGAIGQSGTGVNFNVANGNLVVWDKDYGLVGQGTDARFARSYNSQGHSGDADGWRFSFERELIVGSSITRITGDEHRSIFTSISNNTYQSADGSGAHDKIVFNGSDTYTYTEGSTGQTETYQLVAGRWLLQSSVDASGQGISLRYDAQNRVSRVFQTNGENTWLKYDASNRLTSLETYLDVNGDGTATKQGTAVHYEYDSYNRLSKVKTDLSPEDNSIADGQYYETAYTYHGTGLQIASVTQSDGTQAHFTYDSSNRILTYKLGSGTDGQQQSFTFDYSQVASRQVSVTDSRNQSWTYQYDTDGRLTHVNSPASSGQRQTAEFAYDSAGNLTKSIDGENRTVDYRYDSNGNLLEQIDSEGNRLVRTYTATNKLKSETRYLTTFNAANIGTYAAPDLSLNSTNADELTTHYIYDTEDRLSFIVSANGAVVEYRYKDNNSQRVASSIIHFDEKYDGANSATEVELKNWRNANVDRTKRSIAHNSFDFRGQLSETKTYGTIDSTGNGVQDESMTLTQFTYDAFGNLLTETQFKGASRNLQYVSSFVYDGMNRLTSTADAQNKSSSISYASNQVITTATNGLTATQTFNSQGLLTSSLKATSDGSASDRATKYFYDLQGRLVASQDNLGGVSYTRHNINGQVNFQIDSTGAVIYYQYDDSGRLELTRHYSERVDTSSWYALLDFTNNQMADNGTITNLLNPNNDTDRISETRYDSAGRIDYTIDGGGNYTHFTYDGASRLIKTEAREGNSTTDARVSRNFYNEDGQLIGHLDAEGYVSETKYNGRGLVVETIRYATQSSEGLRAAGTLSQLITTDSTKDQHSYVRYDGQGRLVLSIDAEGTVTETKYLETGNQVQVIQYAKSYEGALSATNAAIISAVTDSNKRISSTHFDSLGRVEKEINFEGTETEYSYNNANQVTQITVADGKTDIHGNSESRTARTRYNQFGELTGEVADSSSTAKSGSVLDALIASQGTTHRYDNLGRLAETVDAEGNQIFYFYDQAGRLTHTVNGDGEVTQTEFNAFGEVENTRAFANTISTTGLTGGETTSTLTTRINGVASAVRDVISSTHYTQSGQVKTQIQGNGRTSNFEYNGWGDLVKQILSVNDNSIQTSSTEFKYNQRGELTETTNALGNKANSEYDAFGRVIKVTDALGNSTTYEYDKVGRQVLLTDPLNGQVHTTYDAFNRTLTTTDKLGNQTQYIYDDANKTTTIQFADGSTNQSIRNILGETIETKDGLNNSTLFKFNYKGELTHVTDALGNVSESQFDKTGRLETSIDKNGTKTTFTYDQADRVLTQIRDSEGLKQTTTYQYDGLGNTLKVTDPNGNAIQYIYDNQGQPRFIIDAEGGVTENVYDANGNVIETKRFQGTANNILPSLFGGRNTTEGWDLYDSNPAGTVKQIYDSALDSSVISLTGSGLSTGFRLRTTDASGAMINYQTTDQTRLEWDMKYAENFHFHVYVKFTDGSSRYLIYRSDMTGEPRLHTDGYITYPVPELKDGKWHRVSRDIQQDVSAIMPDQTIEGVYDIKIRGTGLIANLNLSYGDEKSISEKLETESFVSSKFVYNALGQVRFTIDAEGFVTENIYDANGNVVETKRYQTKIEITEADLQTARASVQAIQGQAYKAGVLQDNPSLYWQLDETSAGQVFDASGNNNHGTHQGTGGSIGQTGIIAGEGKSLVTSMDRFAGTSTANLNVSSGFTIESWVVPDQAQQDNWHNIGVLWDDADKAVVWMQLNHKDQKVPDISFRDSNDVTYTLAGTKSISDALSVGKAFHVSATWDGSYVQLYVNGELQNSMAFSGELAGFSGSVTTGAGTKPYGMHGQIDEFAVYGHALAQERLVAHYQSGIKQPSGSEILLQALESKLNNVQSQANHYVYNNRGQVRFIIDAEGYVSENVYDANGNMIEAKRYEKQIDSSIVFTEFGVEKFLKSPTWSQNFSEGISGLVSTMSTHTEQLSLEDGFFQFTNNPYNSFSYPILRREREDFVVGKGYRVEITPGEIGNQDNFGLGLVTTLSPSDPNYRIISATFEDGKIQSDVRVGSDVSIKEQDVLNAGTTYVVELETTSTGVTLFVYKKGESRDLGWSESINKTDWTNVQFTLWSTVQPTSEGSIIKVDNMMEYDVDVVSGYTSTRYIHDSLGQVRYSIDAEGYVSESVYDANGNVIETKRYQTKVEITEADIQIARANAEALQGQAYKAGVLQDNPSLYWQLDETSAGQVFDASGNNNHGTHQGTGGSIGQTGIIAGEGKSLVTSMDRFAGTSTANLNVSSGFTIESWVVPDQAQQDNWHNIGVLWDDADKAVVWMQLNHKDQKVPDISFRDSNDVTYTLAGTKSISDALSVGKAFHVSATWDGSYVQLYVNGELQNSMAFSGELAGFSGSVTTGAGTKPYGMHGQIDEFAVYGHALAQERLVAHYQSGIKQPSGSEILTQALESKFNKVQSQASHYVYNKLGQVRYTIDAEGYVSENSYDANGNVVETKRFVQPLVDNQAYTEEKLESMLGQSVTWLGDKNVSIDNGLITKTAGADGYNASSYSKEQITGGNGGVRFKVPSTTNNRIFVGLNDVASSSESYSDMEHSIFIYAGHAYVYESAANPFVATNVHKIDTEYRIQAKNNQVYYQYKQAGDSAFTTFYTSTKTLDAAKSYQVDTSLFYTGNVISDVVIENTAETYSSISTQYIYNAVGQVRYTIDAEGYVSENSYDANGNVVETKRFVQPLVDNQAYTEEKLESMLGQSVTWLGDKNVSIDNGLITKTAGADGYNASSYSKEQITGGNGGVRFKVPSTTNNRIFVGLNDVASSSESYSDMEHSIFIYAGHAYVYESAANPFVATNVHKIDTEYRIQAKNNQVYYQYKQAGDSAFTTFYTSTKTLDAAKSYQVDTSLFYTGNVISDVVIENTAETYSSISTQYIYNAVGQVRYTIDAEGYVSENSYDANGNVVETKRFVQPLVDNQAYTEEKLESMLGQSVTWLGDKNVSIDNGLITKTAGADGYNASSYSKEQITGGNGGVRFKVPSTTNNRIFVGLNDVASSSESYSDMEHSIFIYAGHAYVYESAANPFVATNVHKIDTEYRIQAKNNQVYYQYKQAGDSAFTTFYTSTKTLDAAKSYQVDTSLFYTGNVISDVVIENTAETYSSISTQYIYNAVGQVRYTIDAEGYVSENSYDANGNVVETKRFVQPLVDNQAYTEEKLESMLGQSVTWLGDKNVSIDNGLITKTAGADGYNASSYSKEQITGGNGGVRFKVPSTTNNRIFVGLNDVASSSESYSDMEHSIFIYAGHAYVYESAANPFVATNVHKIDTEYRIQAKNNQVYYQYKQAGDSAFTTFYTSTKTLDAAKSYQVDTSLFYTGNVISDVVIENTAETYSSISTQYIYNAVGQVRYTIDAEGYVSENSYDANGNVVETKRFVQPLVDNQAYTEEKLESMLGQSVTWLGDKNVSIDNGLITKTAGADGYNASSYSKEQITGGNGGVRFKVPSTTNNRIFVGLNDVASSSESYSDMEHSIFIYAGHAYVYESAANPFVATNVHKIDTEYRIQAKNNQVYYQYKQAGDSAFTTFYTSTKTLDAAKSYQVDTSLFYTGNVISDVVIENTAETYSSISTQYIYNAVGQVRYTIDAEGYVTENVYDANGNVVKVNRYAHQVGGSLLESVNDNVIREAVQFIGAEHLTGTGNSLEKTGGDHAAFDATVQSVQRIEDGEGTLGFMVNATSPNMVVGLSRGTNSGPGFADIDHGIYINTWGIQIFENNATAHTSTLKHVAGSEYRVVMASGQIQYQVIQPSSADFVTIYTSAVTPDETASYYLDTSMRYQGSDISDVYFESNLSEVASTQYVYNKLGQVRFTIDAEGYVTESIYDSSNNVIESISYHTKIELNGNNNTEADIREALVSAETILGTPIKFNTSETPAYVINNRKNSTAISLGMNNVFGMADNRAVIFKRAFWDLTATTYDTIVFDEKRLPSEYSSLSYEFTTEQTITDGGFYGGLDNNASTNPYRHGIIVDGKNLQVEQVVNGLASTITLGTLKGATSYIVEYEVANGQSTIYVYEKGQSKDEAMTHTMSLSDATWGSQTGLKFYAKPGGIQGGVVYLDNVITNSQIVQVPSDFSTSRSIYNNLGQVRFSIDGEGNVTENQYDAFGRLVSASKYKTAYTATDYAYDTLKTWSESQSAIEQSRQVFDQNGRVRFVIDAKGYTTENDYDAFGNVVKATRYDVALSSSTSLTEDAIDNFFATNNSGQVTQFSYDKRNYLASTIDAKNYTESYTYDAFGNQIAFENKKGYVWNYEYDKRGNLINEITPEVEVKSADASSSANQRLTKHFTYDAFGNVLTITDAFGTSQAITTSYSYDSRGNQTTTTYHDQGVYNASQDKVINTGTQSTNTTLNNAFGLAVVNINELGKASYRTYTANKQLEFEIDAEGFVTRYQYNSQGKVSNMTRYATALTSSNLASFASFGTNGVNLNSADVQNAVVSSNNDRTVETLYNSRGQQVSVKQSSVTGYNSSSKSSYTSSPETTYQYNGLGQVVKQSTKIDKTTWAHQYTYYNELGLVSASVDALGYLTTYEYDAFGNLERQIEYAQKLSGSWNENSQPAGVSHAGNRVTNYGYDAMNRRTTTTLKDVEVGQYNHKQGSFFNSNTDVITQVGYDALGQVETNTDALNQFTRTTYDKLGRVMSIQEAARNVKKDGVYDPFISSGYVSVTPTTSMHYDALGNQVETVRSSGNSSASGDDIRTTILFDRHGNKVRTTDALGHQVFYSYNAKGQIESQSQTVTELYYKTERVLIGRRINEVRDGQFYWEDIYEDRTVVDESRSNERVLETQFKYNDNGLQTETWSKKDDGSYAKEQVDFNAFGEIAQKGVNGTFYETFNYNRAGQVTSSNTGDGVTKSFGYDLRGAQTHEQINANNSNAWTTDNKTRHTYIIYDVNGQAVRQELPEFTSQNGSVNSSAESVKTPILLQEFDRWGNIIKSTEKPIDSSESNPDNFKTEFVFNKANQLIQEMKPDSTYWNESGSSASYTPTTLHFYDKAGNRIGERQGRNDDSGQHRRFEYNTSGQMTASYDALGHSTQFAYDAHSKRVATRNALGHVTTENYDLNGQLISKGILRKGTSAAYVSGTSSTSNLTDVLIYSYTYDDAGRRTGEYKGDVVDSNVVNFLKYDSRNQLVFTRNASGVEKTFEYDDQGRKINENDGLNNNLSWTFDYFGRVLTYTNLNNRTTTYSYDAMGQMVKEDYSNTGSYSEYRSYDYYENGLLKSISDHKERGSHGSDPSGSGRTDDYYSNILTDTFAYDIAGNRVWEKTDNQLRYADQINTGGGGGGGGGGDPVDPPYLEPYSLDPVAVKSLGTTTQSVTTSSTIIKTVGADGFAREVFTEFDKLGRIVKVKSPEGAASQVDLNLVENLYDEFGNKRAIKLKYEYANSDNQIDRSHWYTYDKENRLTTSKGELISGSVQAGDYGTSIEYDAAGQRTFATQYKGRYSTAIWEGPDYIGMQYWDTSRREKYSYNDLGHLTNREAQTIVDRSGAMSFGQFGDYTSSFKQLSIRQVDLWGRLTQETTFKENWPSSLSLTKNYNIANLFSTSNEGYSNFIYLKDDRLVVQNNYDNNNKVVSKVDYTNGFDAAGNLTSYQATAYKTNGSVNYTTDYTVTYKKYDGYVRNTEVASSSLADFKDGTTTYSYDYKGNLEKVVVQDRDDASNTETRTFKTNRQGMTVYRKDGSNFQNYFYTNGRSVASIGSISGVEFDYNYTPISDKYPSNSPSQYVVNEGDTLRLIAQRVYGDESLWYVVGEANGITDDSQLIAGQTLTISQEILNHNNADTFKPYNPGEIIGDTSPIPIAPPPPEEKCGALTAIIQIVVTIVVTIYSGGNAAAGAAAGDAAGQTASAMFNGRFDWENFIKGNLNPLEDLKRMLVFSNPLTTAYALNEAASGDKEARQLFNRLEYGFDYDYERTAIAAASAYVGGAANFGGVGGAITGASVSYATNYSLNRLAGNDVSSFSLRGLVASAGTAGLMEGLTNDWSWSGEGTDSAASASAPKADPKFEWSNIVDDWNSGEFARSFFTNVGQSALQYGIGKAIGDKNAHWDGRNVIANAFGSTIGNSVMGQLKLQKEAREAKEQAEKIRQQQQELERMRQQGINVDAIFNYDKSLFPSISDMIGDSIGQTQFEKDVKAMKLPSQVELPVEAPVVEEPESSSAPGLHSDKRIQQLERQGVVFFVDPEGGRYGIPSSPKTSRSGIRLKGGGMPGLLLDTQLQYMERLKDLGIDPAKDIERAIASIDTSGITEVGDILAAEFNMMMWNESDWKFEAKTYADNMLLRQSTFGMTEFDAHLELALSRPFYYSSIREKAVEFGFNFVADDSQGATVLVNPMPEPGEFDFGPLIFPIDDSAGQALILTTPNNQGLLDSWNPPLLIPDNVGPTIYVNDGGLNGFEIPNLVFSEWGKKVRGTPDVFAPEGYEKHHLIGIENAAKFDVMRYAVDSLKYDINGGPNGIALPGRSISADWGKKESLRTGLPYHGGGHISEYNEFVEHQLNLLDTDYQFGLVNDSQILNRITVIENQVRFALENNDVRLQHVDPRAKKGK